MAGFWNVGKVVLGGVALATAAVGTDASRPNVVLIIGDDVSPDFGCYGGPVHTPNIDQLAQNGMRFENAYVAASSCSPSRCSIITGRYPHNTGAPELHMDLPEGQYLFPGSLKEAGYYAVQYGKWHMGDYARNGFTQVYDVEYSEDPTGAARWVQCLSERPEGPPFFMWFAAFDAHRPWEPYPEGRTYAPEEAILPAGVPDTPIAREDMVAYYSEVERFDMYVGQVVDELKRQGVFEDTLIILLGDNGRPFPRNKTTLYDNGMKTPLIVHWPNGPVRQGSVSSSLVSAIDIAPTILQVAGLEIPEPVQGVSFLPVLTDPLAVTRDILFGERNWHVMQACGRMVRVGDYVYFRNYTPRTFRIATPNTGGSYAELLRLKAEGNLAAPLDEFCTDAPDEMLFRLSRDPQQLHNLIGNPEEAQTLNQLRELMSTWQTQTGDSIPDVSEMTDFRNHPETFVKQYPERRPPTGVLPGERAGATKINQTGPVRGDAF